MSPKKIESLLELHQVGDTELWYAEAADKAWMLPLHVDWREDVVRHNAYGVVMPATCLTPPQVLVLRNLLEHHALEAGRTDRWILPSHIVRQLLYKAQGITLHKYYRWIDGTPPIPFSSSVAAKLRAMGEQRHEDGYRNFAEFVADQRNLPLDIVMVVMGAMGDLATTWMVQYRKPIDFGFCRMVALPFRTNWKEIVLFKARSLKLGQLLQWKKEPREKALKELEFDGILCSPHNMGMRQRTVTYTLEALPDQSFDRQTYLIEKERKEKGTATEYIEQFERTVESLYEFILQALALRIKKMALPFGAICERGKRGILGLLPAGRKAVMREMDANGIPVHIVPPTSAFSVLSRKSDPRLVQAQTEAMQKVRSVLQTSPDMWQWGERTDVVKRWKGGTARLPVRDDKESVDAGKPMLPGTTPADGNASGMDGT